MDMPVKNHVLMAIPSQVSTTVHVILAGLESTVTRNVLTMVKLLEGNVNVTSTGGETYVTLLVVLVSGKAAANMESVTLSLTTVTASLDGLVQDVKSLTVLVNRTATTGEPVILPMIPQSVWTVSLDGWDLLVMTFV